MEFSKLIITLVMILYFLGAVFAGIIICFEKSLLPYLLTYLGTPSVTAFGFYIWKAKAENCLKYNNSLKTKQVIINNAFKETEGGESNEGF